MNRVRIKICGITNVDDAKLCVSVGVEMIGLNFYPKSPRYISPAQAREIVEATRNRIEHVGVFVDASAEQVRDVAAIVDLRSMQLHGAASPEICRDLAQEFRVIRALRTDESFRPETASAFAGCDVLVDAHHSELHGGTGTTCDWPAAHATRAFTRFLILSGGLTSDNVADAIAQVGPHAVDVCSGVEQAPGIKDQDAVKNFVTAARG